MDPEDLRSTLQQRRFMIIEPIVASHVTFDIRCEDCDEAAADCRRV